MITIRNEQPADYRVVEEITRDAFWNLYCPGCNEHYIVHALREHADYIPELDFVMEKDGQVVGSILYSRSTIVTESGDEIATITFGPVSIKPGLQHQGLGRALISHSLEQARQRGYRAVIIGGYPGYYGKYGFMGAKKYGLCLPDGCFYTGIMALPLYPGALDGIRGKIVFSSAFEVDEHDLARFEEQFPPKEKGVQPSQEEFQQASSEIDTRTYDD